MRLFHIFLLAFAVGFATVLPSIAQEKPQEQKQEDTQQQAEKENATDSDKKLAATEKRMKLAEEMHKIWPVRAKIESVIDTIGKQIKPSERAKYKAAMRKAINYEQIEDESIIAMAEIFTEEELRAMVDFYGSKEGRAITAKIEDYENAMRPVITKAMDKAVLDMRIGNVPVDK